VKVTIDLPDEDYLLLKTRAAKEMRSIRAQVAYDIREAVNKDISDRKEWRKMNNEAAKFAKKTLLDTMTQESVGPMEKL
tara:strand:+ start:830 stop:1066 length:237 start_codon:yes stop_codon:yes gene_type:complete